MSVVLRDDPKGPVMTITHIRNESSPRTIAVAWLDVLNNRCQAEFADAELIAPAG